MNEQEIFKKAIKQIELGIGRPISARGGSALREAIHEAYEAGFKKGVKELDKLGIEAKLYNDRTRREYQALKKKYLKE